MLIYTPLERWGCYHFIKWKRLHSYVYIKELRDNHAKLPMLSQVEAVRNLSILYDIYVLGRLSSMKARIWLKSEYNLFLEIISLVTGRHHLEVNNQEQAMYYQLTSGPWCILPQWSLNKFIYLCCSNLQLPLLLIRSS
jgi:hypothetical protein